MIAFCLDANSRIRRATSCLLTTTLLFVSIAGCGSSTNPPVTPVTPTKPQVQTSGSDFTPRPFTVSPGYASSINYGPRFTKPKVKAADSTSGSSATFNHWFYLVNGEGIPAGSEDTFTAFTPNVMRVNGSAPQGAPNPNGGTGVSAVPFAPNNVGSNPPASAIPFDGSQLWKAVAGPNGTYYLRSAQSFEVNTTTTNLPSLLVGNGAPTAALDLGYLSNWNTSVYWNQQDSPTGDNSPFQQWTYSSETAQLTNVSAKGQLDNAGGPTLSVDTNPVAPSSQWYAVPNYSIEQVLAQPSETFPAFSGSQESVYEWMSAQISPGVSLEACPAYSEGGIRCLYNNINTTGPITACIAESAIWLAYGLPTNTNSQNFSASDFSAVAQQLNTECSDVSEVEATFTTYQTIISDVFINATDSLPGLATDVGVSLDNPLNPVPIEIIEGTLYTIMSALGPVSSAIANVMAAATTSALSANADNNSQLTSTLKTTVGDLYADMATQFAVINTGLGTAETQILGDWGKLNTIGPLTLKTGYNGLGMTPDQQVDVEKQLANAYKLVVMQQLMPIPQLPTWYMAVDSDSETGETGSTWSQYSYPTFGNIPGEYNVFWSGEAGSSYFSQTVLQTDIQDNGANMFDFWNGINGWKTMPAYPYSLMSCIDTAVIFNASPNDLQVKVDPDQGTIGSPGAGYLGTIGGSTQPYTFELRPYGYLPFFSAPDGNNYRMDVSIFDNSYSSSNSVGYFAIIQDGCGAEYHIDTSATTNADNYLFTSFQDVNDNSLWTTIYKNN